ncbi:unnamed protein product, partial [Phaeothamnion confervicola]
LCPALKTTPAFAQQADVKTLLDRAKSLAEEQRLDEASKIYTEVLQKEPNNPLALYQMGWISNEKHQFEDAVKYFKQLDTSSQGTHKIYGELGFAYRKLGQADEAQKAYEKACKAKEDYAPAWLGLGDVLFVLKKDYVGAAKAYEKGLLLAPNNAIASYRLGWCLNDSGEPAKALPFLQIAVRQEPKYQAAFVEIAFCQLKLGKSKEALEASRRALALEKNSVLGNYYAGLAYVRLNQKDKAQEQVVILKKLSPERAQKLEAAMK